MPDPTQPRRYSADNPFAQQAAPVPTTGGTYSPDNPFAPASTASTPETPESFGDQAAGFGRALVGQGLLAGFGDEAEGGVRALIDAAKGQPLGQSYTRERDAIRAQQAAYAKRHPVLNTGAEIAGGLAGALIPVGGTELRALSTLGKVVRAGGVGAVYGGIAGLGKGEGDALSQAKSTVGGAVLGGVLGGAFQTAGSAAGAVARRLHEPAAESAVRHVATAASRATDIAPHAEGMTFADMLGPPGQKLLDYTVLTPSQGGTEAAQYLTGRATTRGARLQSAVEDALGTGRGDVVADDAALNAARTAAAKQNYGAAYQETVPVQIFDRLVKIKGPNPFARAYEHGRASASIDGVDLPTWAQIEDAFNDPRLTALHEVPVQALDYMQRGIGKLVRRGGESDFAIDRTDARNMYAALKDVMAQGDAHAPAFAKARADFHDASEVIDALAEGQTALGQKPGAISASLAGKSEPAQQRFRQGMAEDVRSRITGKDVLGTKSLRAIQAPETLDRLAAGATDAPAALGLRRAVAAEERMQPTEALALRQSATTPRNQVIQDVEGAGLRELAEPAKAGMSLFAGNPLPALQILLQKGSARYLHGMTERRANALAPLLLAGRNGPQEVEDVVRLIEAYNASRDIPVPSTAAAGRVGGRAIAALLGKY
jgi:hypothetical protein